MKELDVLLERYVQWWLPGSSSEERQTLTRLLELPDPVLSDYLFGHAAAPDHDAHPDADGRPHCNAAAGCDLYPDRDTHRDPDSHAYVDTCLR